MTGLQFSFYLVLDFRERSNQSRWKVETRRWETVPVLMSTEQEPDGSLRQALALNALSRSQDRLPMWQRMRAWMQKCAEWPMLVHLRCRTVLHSLLSPICLESYHFLTVSFSAFDTCGYKETLMARVDLGKAVVLLQGNCNSRGF